MTTTSKPLPIHILINLLFQHIQKNNGSHFTNTEVANSIGISKSSLTVIRNGDQNNPTLNTIRAILSFFDVPSTYLDATSEEEAVKIIKASITDNNINIRLRNLEATELSPRAINQIQQIVKYTLELHNAQLHSLPEPELPEFTSKNEEFGIDNNSD